jgi:hypothetical protein
MDTPADAIADLTTYIQGDIQTRSLIELQLDRNHFLARHQVALQWTGLFLGFLITIGFLAVSGWLVNGGHDVSGCIIGTVDLVALVTIFVIGRRS